MRIPFPAGKLGFVILCGLAGWMGEASAAVPALAGSSRIDLTYDVQNPSDLQFGVPVAFSGSPTSYAATGLPPGAFINTSTGWVNGSRNNPGVYDATITATNADGTGTAVVRFAIHPAAIGFGTTAGEYHMGQTLSFNVSFNTAVTVAAGAKLTFFVGQDGNATTRDAVYFSGSGTQDIVYRYTVQAGDTDPDGVAVLGNALDTTAVVDASGLTVGGALPVRYFYSGITIVADAASPNPSDTTTPPTTPPPSSSDSTSTTTPPTNSNSGSGPSTSNPPAETPPPPASSTPAPPPATDPVASSTSSSASGATSTSTATSAPVDSSPAPASQPVLPVVADPVSTTPVATTSNSGNASVATEGPVASAPADPAPAAAAVVVPHSQLANVSTRMRVADGDASRTLIMGFVVSGSAPKRVLVRAVGPGLASFGLANVLSNPGLQVYDNSNAVVAGNDNWSGVDTSVTAGAVGAFPLNVSSADAALAISLQPGVHTLMVVPNGGTGEVLAEVYDAGDGSADDSSRIVNLSTRGRVDGADNPLIAGFVIKGDKPRRVLIRAVGPGLAPFGVGDTLADPLLKVYADQRLIAENDNWQSTAPADIAAAASASGAFALANGSTDAAVMLTLQPGLYTGVVSGSGNPSASGAALVEVYEIPDGAL